MFDGPALSAETVAIRTRFSRMAELWIGYAFIDSVFTAFKNSETQFSMDTFVLSLIVMLIVSVVPLTLWILSYWRFVPSSSGLATVTAWLTVVMGVLCSLLFFFSLPIQLIEYVDGTPTLLAIAMLGRLISLGVSITLVVLGVLQIRGIGAVRTQPQAPIGQM
jgi:hypothetical protein